jgi:hypothetical protein
MPPVPPLDHIPLRHSKSWLHDGSGLVPYSHSTPSGMHAVLGEGAFAGQGDVPPPLLLLLPLDPPLPLPLPPPLLPPLPLLLPPDPPPLEPALPLLDPEPPWPSLPASAPDVNVLPPQPAPPTPPHTMTAAETTAPNQSKHRM